MPWRRLDEKQPTFNDRFWPKAACRAVGTEWPLLGHRGSFLTPPEEEFARSEICVTGKLTEYEGTLQMQIGTVKLRGCLADWPDE